MLLVVAWSYAARPDACAAITVWPAWMWLAPGLLLVLAAIRRRRNRGPVFVVLLWAAFLLLFAEEPITLLRTLRWPEPAWTAARLRGSAIRVVSINCAGGSPEAAREAGRFHPDLILYQESPPPAQLAAVVKRLFGSKAALVIGLDASIAARGKLTPVPLPPLERMHFVEARVRLDSGIELEAISARLSPAPLRMDLWSPSCWAEQAANRRLHRDQMRAIAVRIGTVPKAVPVILGGDFNAPQGDAVFRLLQPRLRDAFVEAGTGWGDTIINEIPALRIDQIWVSRQWRLAIAFARKTVYSDHRMVVCDLILAPGR